MKDRRALARQETAFNAKLIFTDAARILDCRVVDMTADGARLEFFSALEIPDRFYLWERQTNSVFECAVEWRQPGIMGISFASSCGHVMRQAIVEACSLGPVPQAKASRQLLHRAAQRQRGNVRARRRSAR